MDNLDSVGNSSTRMGQDKQHEEEQEKARLQQTSFPLFVMLPAEIRVMIWKYFWDDETNPTVHLFSVIIGRKSSRLVKRAHRFEHIQDLYELLLKRFHRLAFPGEQHPIYWDGRSEPLHLRYYPRREPLGEWQPPANPKQSHWFSSLPYNMADLSKPDGDLVLMIRQTRYLFLNLHPGIEGIGEDDQEALRLSASVHTIFLVAYEEPRAACASCSRVTCERHRGRIDFGTYYIITLKRKSYQADEFTRRIRKILGDDANKIRIEHVVHADRYYARNLSAGPRYPRTQRRHPTQPESLAHSVTGA
jgi:hypothetical protein